MFIKNILNKKNKLIFFLNKKLIPKNFDKTRFEYIFTNLKVKKNIFCLPDLNFKSKNFIPSGVSVPLVNSISPILLTPNNDSIGSLHFKIDLKLEKNQLKKILSYLKKNIAIYRRKKKNVSEFEAKNILKFGCKNIYKKWGFNHRDISSIYNKGSEKINLNINKLINFYSKKKPKSLPPYIAEYNLFNVAKKSLGVLDGSSHFIEFFKVKKIINQNQCKKLDIDTNSLFCLVHGGPADVGRIIHHNILDLKKKEIPLKKIESNFYFDSYKAASNYAFANRLYIYKTIKQALLNFCKISFFEIFSDLPHDYIYKNNSIYYHNKGVVQMLNKKDSIKKKYKWKKTGSPYILPTFSSGDAFIFLPIKNNKINFISHGIGRALDKEESAKKFKTHGIGKLNKDFLLCTYNKDNINSQSPKSFKKANLVLNSIKKNKLGKNICTLMSLGALKA